MEKVRFIADVLQNIIFLPGNRDKLIAFLLFFIIPGYVLAQNQHVSGVVSDSNGSPVIGAAVMIQGTTTGTTTDDEGHFELSGITDNAILEVSSLGYKTEVLSVAQKPYLEITLVEDTSYLDEVVVVGYGTTTRRHIISSVSTVNAASIQDRPVANVQQALQGAAANLVIQTTNFNPAADDGMNISIRGVSTMGNNAPLVVIDGVPQSDTDRMNELNPDDIASISILKDAGSSAIYGARSSNGVILITTKTGKKDTAPVVKFSAQVGIQNPHILIDPIPSYQNAILRNESLVNVGQNPIFTASDISDLYGHGDSEFLLDQAMKNALQQTYNVSVSGGTKNTTYMISARYFDQDSNFIGPNYGTKRYNIRSNITTELGRLKLGLNLGFTGEHKKTTAGTSLIADLTRYPTYYFSRVKDEATGVYFANNYKWGGRAGNKIAELESGGYNKFDNNFATATFTAEYSIIDGLKLRTVLNGEIRNTHRFTDKTSYMLATDNGSVWSDPSTAVAAGNTTDPADDLVQKDTYLSGQVVLDFNRTFGGKHNVTALVGWSQESNYHYSLKVGKSYLNGLNQPGENTVIETDGTALSSEDNTRWSLQSFFGRFGYSYAERYYVELIARYDMSSRFMKARNAGFFPAVNLGWRISQEDFMSDYRYNVGDLKLRMSYGFNGNQQGIDLYDFITKYQIEQNIYGFNDVSVPGLAYTMGNELLTWEKSRTFNVGLDASFFKNSLSVNFDWFYKRTSNILLDPIIPGSFGSDIGKENRGVMDNQGWELTVNYNLARGDWNHNFSLNIADSKNKVVKYGARSITLRDGTRYLIEEGLPFNSYYGYKFDGFFQSYEEIQNSPTPTNIDKSKLAPGDVKFKDLDKDGDIDDNDRTYLGYAYPRYTFGFTYNVSWKGIDLSIMLQGVLKRNFIVRGELLEPFHADYGMTMYEHQLDYWTPLNMDARWPRLAKTGTPSKQNNWAQSSDMNMLNGAYLRVKNIQLGYTFPSKWTQKFGCRSLRIFFDAQNPFTVTANKFIDPESSEFAANMSTSTANSARNYPTLRYFGGGINVTF